MNRIPSLVWKQVHLFLWKWTVYTVELSDFFLCQILVCTHLEREIWRGQRQRLETYPNLFPELLTWQAKIVLVHGGKACPVTKRAATFPEAGLSIFLSMWDWALIEKTSSKTDPEGTKCCFQPSVQINGALCFTKVVCVGEGRQTLFHLARPGCFDCMAVWVRILLPSRKLGNRIPSTMPVPVWGFWMSWSMLTGEERYGYLLTCFQGFFSWKKWCGNS